MIESNRDCDSPSNHIPADAKCIECGYRLLGLFNTVCPECGLPFEPDDPETYHTPSLPNWIRKNSHPPRKRYVWCFFIVLLLTILDVSSPGHAHLAICLWTPACVLAIFFLSLDWVLKVIARRVAQELPGVKDSEPLRRWLWTPIMIAVVISLLMYPWPAYLRFQLSKVAMEKAINNPPAIAHPESVQIGFFWVQRVTKNLDGSVFFETGVKFLDMSGFLYVPASSLPLMGDYYLDHKLTENWYIGGERF